jgi:HK97 family phage major capsid protein
MPSDPPRRIGRDKMKTARLIDLQRKTAGLREDCRSALHDLGEAIDGNKPQADIRALERQHDKLMTEWDLHQLDLDEERGADVTDVCRRPDQSGEALGVDDGRGGGVWPFRGDTGWRDKNGEPVRVLSRSQNFAERASRGGECGFGDMIRAKITGPRNEEEKRALSEGTDSAGGYTVPTPLAQQFIDRLRTQSVAIRAGALTVPMESETLAIARLLTDPTVAWRAENAAIAEGDPTFDRVTFTAKTLAGGIKVSRELAEDSINVGSMIEHAFAKTMAEKLDYAALYGPGTDNSPTGVTATSGINSISMGTNGAALADYDRLIDAVYELQLDNADDPTAMVMHPRTAAALAKLKDANDNPLSVPEMIARIPRLSTTAASIAETEGTAVNASAIIVGDFRHLLIGVRHNIEVRVFDQAFASTGQLYVVAWLRADVQLSQAKSFCELTGVIPA